MVDDDDKAHNEVPSIADSSPPDSDSVPPDAPTMVQDLPEPLREQMVKAGILPPNAGKGHVIPAAPPVPRIPGVGGPVARPAPPKPARPAAPTGAAVAQASAQTSAATAADPMATTSEEEVPANADPHESGANAIEPDSADTSGVERVVGGPASSGEQMLYAPPTAHLASPVESLAATVVGTQPIPLLTREQAAQRLAQEQSVPDAAPPPPPLDVPPPPPDLAATLAAQAAPPLPSPPAAPPVPPDHVQAGQLQGPSRAHYPPPIFDGRLPGTAAAPTVSGVGWAIGGIIVGLVLLGVLIALIVVLLQKL